MAQYQYPFRNPSLPIQARVTNILSLMTIDEKIACLSTLPDVPRLGIHGAGHVEGAFMDWRWVVPADGVGHPLFRARNFRRLSAWGIPGIPN